MLPEADSSHVILPSPRVERHGRQLASLLNAITVFDRLF